MTFGTGRLICSALVEAGHNAHAITGGLFTFDCDEAKMPHKPTILFFVGDIVVVVLEGNDLLTLVVMSDQDYISNISFIKKPELTATFEERGSTVLSVFNRWIDLLRDQPKVRANYEDGYLYPVAVDPIIDSDTVVDSTDTVAVELNFESVGGESAHVDSTPTTYSDSSSSYSGD